jgi:hypothetical protein
MPRSALAELADEQGATHVHYNIATGTSILDPVVAHLGACLLPALTKIHRTAQTRIGRARAKPAQRFFRNEIEKKEQGHSPARKIVSTLFPRMFGFILD